MQPGFYFNATHSSSIHKHKYTEVHLISSENTVFNIETQKYKIENEAMLVIPGGVYHSYSGEEIPRFHTAFQIDLDIKDFSIHSVDPVITAALFNEIDSAVKCGDHTGVALYISLLSRQFYNEEKTAASHISDYGFLINEFFSVHYSENIHLCDLAAELHLSMRQTERLVIKHRGKTFKDSLAETRINMAKYLMNNTDLSLVDIAEYVGYNSYSGLWKAIKNHGEI